jgi:hypothetical protein
MEPGMPAGIQAIVLITPSLYSNRAPSWSLKS